MAAASLGAITSTPFLNPLNTKQHHQLQQQEMTRQQQMALWQLMISRASQQQQQSQLIQHKATSPLSPPVRYTTTTQPTLYSINISEVERLRQVSPKKEGQQKKAEESPKSAKGSGSNFSIEFILKKEETDVSKSPRQSPATPISPSSGAFQLPKAFIYTPPQKYEQAAVFGGMVYGSSSFSRSLKRRRKLRTVFTSKQLAGLEKAFTDKKYLSVPDRIKLAMELELSDTQVKTWFQNRRMKEKKLQDGPQRDTESVSDRADTPNSPGSISSSSIDNLEEDCCMDL